MASDIEDVILLAAEKPVAVDFISDLKKMVNDDMEEEVRVEVYVFKNVGVVHDK